ncbi:MAG: DUF1573 domain-containing protein [Planctomycetota bacterium]|nr:DUF1573 domain-containing protein [Planctomycetota bacterium]
MRGARIAILQLLLVLGLPLLGGAPASAEDPAPAGQGDLAWDRVEYDFGSVGQNQELEAVFTYTNRGETTVSDIRAQPDCGCYGLMLSDTILGPGESGTLKVRFRTLTFIGKVLKHARVQYEDKAPRRVKLGLQMTVDAGVLLEPSRVYFGEVVVGTKPRGEIHLQHRDGRGKPFRITKVHLPDEDFEPITPAPYTDPRDPKWKGWTLTFQFARVPPQGVYSKHAVVETDHPDFPRVRVSLTANVVGKVWIQKPRLFFGLIARGETRTLKTLVRPALGSGVRLGKVSARSRKGVLKTELVPVPGRPEHYTLAITLPGNAKAGLLDDVIELRTQVDGEAVTTVDVRGRVFERR